MFHLVFEEANLRELGVEVRPRQTNVLACVVLAGTRRETSESKSSSVNSL